MSSLPLEISTDPRRIDLDLVHQFLGASYWAQGRPRDVVERSIRNSLCFGVYLGSSQVGFGRVITDRAVFAYIADVFVVPAWRKHGIARTLIQTMLEHPDVSGLQVVLLRTRDAHGLYSKFGFEPVSRPEELMARRVL